MSKDELIVRQVAFKGVIDLVINDKVEINDIESTVDEFSNIMMKGYQPATNFGNGLPKRNISVGQGMQGNASEKQVAWINKLIKQVDDQGYQALASDSREAVAKGLSKQTASDLIDILQDPTKHLQEKAKNVKVVAQPVSDDDDVAPF